MSDSMPSKSWRNMRCGSCRLQFFIKDTTLKGSRCPMLLQCGHSICESCIHQNVKTAKIITCQICGSTQSLQLTDQISVSDCFPLNIYLLGSLVALQYTRHGRDKNFKAFLLEKSGNFNYKVKEQEKLNIKFDANRNSCEECSLAALWYCENCKSNFCEICWSRVHGSARSLMRHSKMAITMMQNETSLVGWRKCPEHRSQDLEFYCKGCSVTVCSHCIILHHQGEDHCPVTLKEKNAEMIGDLRTAAEEAEKINKRMRHTLEKIKLTQRSSEAPASPFPELERQITRNFSQIHGILQLEEDRLLRKLHENWNGRESCVRTLRLQLENQIQNVECLLHRYEVLVRNPRECDLTELHRRLEDAQNLPCYLISRNSGSEEVRLAFDERLTDLLNACYAMVLPPSETFELRSSSDLPEGYAVEPLTVSDSEQDVNCAPRSDLESSASDTDAFSNCSSCDLAIRDVELPLAKGLVFQEKKNYSVRVSYIKNPGEFYVTLNSQRAEQLAIDKRASHFANCSPQRITPAAVTKDDVYLVKHRLDEKWYRARVVEVFPPNEIWDEECVLVYYLDHGNSERVPVSRLIPIPPDMFQPPLAVRCKLFDCVPKGGEWCADSAKTMENILNNCTATMFVMKVHRHCLEVDLSVIYPDGQIGRDIVSVRDALLFLELSSFVHGSEIPRTATTVKFPRQYLPSAGEILDVTITHVNSPSDFYVQKVEQDISYLYKLTIDLQKCYSENSEKCIIYNPTIGMPCAALFPADRRWYRAKIVDIPGKKMVTVFYVDYGNKETIPWTEIRKLKESFVKCPVLALNCALVDVAPVSDTWTDKARSYMEECLMVKGCRIHVLGRPKSKQKLTVLLYKQANGTEVCLNSFLVSMECAIKTNPACFWTLKDGAAKGTALEKGISKITKSWKRSIKSREDINETTSHGERELFRKTRIFKDRKKYKLSAKKLRELHESEKGKVGQASSIDTEDTENEVGEFDSIFKVKVEILSAESPSSIYVTFPALMEEFKHLQSKLNEFYQNSSGAAIEWEAGSVCAVFDSTRGSWYRASVLCTLSDGQVKVFLKDVAQVSFQPVTCLRELDYSFTKYPTCAVKCHLADVAPPGEQWPSISSEFLICELEKFKEVYMTKRGQIDNKSLPVELWVQKIVPGGALEPSAKEWVTLNRLLVNEGLAIPMKQKIWSSGVPSNDEEYWDDVKQSESARMARGGGSSAGEEVDHEVGGASGPHRGIPSLGHRWLPPEPLKGSCFVGTPTYADFNACIHIYDTDQDAEQLKVIRETLLKEYGNSKPGSEDHCWSPGQVCIARYHADNLWYRGVITQINEDMTYDVLFVDYGNVETCEAPDLRKGIKKREVPILSRKFQLQGISPASEDGKWPIGIIDLLHSLVVDKQCEVNVIKRSLNPSGPHIASLKLLEDGVDVGDFLVKQGWACFTLSMSDSLDSFEFDFNSSNKDLASLSVKQEAEPEIPQCYNSLNIPDGCDGFFIQVTTVKSETEFFANIVVHESTSPSLNRTLNEFDNLTKKLTEECQLQPLLENLVAGQPCCCLRPRSNRWCRGEIESSSKGDNSVCVFFVDYGEKDFFNKDSLHECKDEWLSLPKMAVKFRLANTEKCPDVSESAYMEALTCCLNRSPLFAEILSKDEEILEVRLLTKRDGPLAYQEMMDKELMKFTL